MLNLRAVCVALAIGATASACGTSTRSAPTSTDIPVVASTDAPAAASSVATRSALSLAVTAVPESLAPLQGVFTKYVNVWGVHIVATTPTNDDKLLHAANVLAQYLDNDADGALDNPAVVDAMVANKATLLMAATADEFESLDNVDAVFDFVGSGGQDLYGSETSPARGFDAALEEVHHLILNTGWSQVFPGDLAQAKGSGIADAMDLARGGQFDSIPASYPAGAWYTYDDETCDYTCMITEYTYWAHTSLLGAQQGRSAEIGQEWKLDTAETVRSGDPAATAILEDPQLSLPTVLPDGSYQG